MAYSRDNTSIEVLKKRLKKRFPQYIVWGNHPYHAITEVFRKQENGDLVFVKSYPKNDDMLIEMERAGLLWDPEQIDGGLGLTIPTSNFVVTRKQYIRISELLVTAYDYLTSAQDMADILHVSLRREINALGKKIALIRTLMK